MAARGRQPGFVMSEEHRLKIKNSNILSVLISAAEGEREVSATQAQIGLGLLRKVLPDLSTVEQKGEQNHNVTFGWKSNTSKSTTAPESSSSPSTTEQSDLPALSPTAEPGKP